MIIKFLLESSTKFLLDIFKVPASGAAMDESSLICAVPPTWKVLIVSWVPGSPIDWAAIIPTHSPIETGIPLARSLP